jgi:hypothetical protein
MKIKCNVIAAIIIVLFLLGATTLQAQGIYSNSKTADKKSDSGSGSGGGGGTLYRDWGDGSDDGDPGDGGDPERPGEPGGPSTRDPIGEGIVILSLLSGGYALIKRNVRKKLEK